jgi:hypothetical protein
MPPLFQFALLCLTALVVVSLVLCLLFDQGGREARPETVAKPETPKPQPEPILIKASSALGSPKQVTAWAAPMVSEPALAPERPTPAFAQPEPVSVVQRHETAVQELRSDPLPSDGLLKKDRDVALERGDSLWDLVVHLRDQVEQLRAERHIHQQEIQQLRAQLSGASLGNAATHIERLH